MSPALLKADAEKHTTYQPLLSYVSLLVAKKQRRKMPLFICGGVSHTGEFSHGLIRGIEWIATKEYGRTVRERRGDGIPPKRASAAVRTQLKDSIASVLFGGWGATLRLGGGSNSKEREFEDMYDF